MIDRRTPPKKETAKPTTPLANLATPGQAALPEDRRKHILDGDGKGGGGHGPGRGTPGNSEFPADWSDDKATKAIEEVANDPASVRVPAARGRTEIRGKRDDIDITVIIGGDGKTIVTAYPTNVPRNGRK